MSDAPRTCTRRTVLRAGLAAVGVGLLHRAGLRPADAAPPAGGAFSSPGIGHPILDLGGVHRLRSRIIDGIPFAEAWTGDGFPGDDFPFHSCENCTAGEFPPAPTERVEVVVIGGGLSGLASAYMLRDRNVALLELRDRVGGAAMGERWRDAAHSLGSAYFIVPDARSSLETLYRELGVWPDAVVDAGGLSVQIDGATIEDLLEWDGLTSTQQDQVARYALIVEQMLEAYPEIPLPDDRDEVARILALDGVSFRDDVEAQVGGPLPKPLAAALQAYFHSSFGVGWEEISAAAGWNFVAAEELGRIVLPGGNAGLAAALWNGLRTEEVRTGRSIVRPDQKVVDVRLHGRGVGGGGVLVTVREGRDTFRSIHAEQVIVATPKFVAKWILHDLETLDPAKRNAMDAVNTCAYVVANVLLDAPVTLPVYDLFLLGDGTYPMDAAAAEANSRIADVLDGGFGVQDGPGSSTLTLYWPLPWPSARFTLVGPGVWEDYAARLAPQVRKIVAGLGIDESRIVQVRMSRWGHAMPIARVGALVDGLPEHLRRPIGDRIWFVNQDNWLLPAVETCLLEAETFTAEVRQRLVS